MVVVQSVVTVQATVPVTQAFPARCGRFRLRRDRLDRRDDRQFEDLGRDIAGHDVLWSRSMSTARSVGPEPRIVQSLRAPLLR